MFIPKKKSLHRLLVFVIPNFFYLGHFARPFLNCGVKVFSVWGANAVYINTGRGAQVVEDDLIKVLKERKDLTAVLDVTTQEPLEDNSPLGALENCIITPHIAGSIGLEVQRMAEYMVDEFVRFKNGETCLYEVTLKMLETMA